MFVSLLFRKSSCVIFLGHIVLWVILSFDRSVGLCIFEAKLNHAKLLRSIFHLLSQWLLREFNWIIQKGISGRLWFVSLRWKENIPKNSAMNTEQHLMKIPSKLSAKWNCQQIVEHLLIALKRIYSKFYSYLVRREHKIKCKSFGNLSDSKQLDHV